MGETISPNWQIKSWIKYTNEMENWFLKEVTPSQRLANQSKRKISHHIFWHSKLSHCGSNNNNDHQPFQKNDLGTLKIKKTMDEVCEEIKTELEKVSKKHYSHKVSNINTLKIKSCGYFFKKKCMRYFSCICI